MSEQDRAEVSQLVEQRIGELIVWLSRLGLAEVVDRPDIDGFENAFGLQNLGELP
jgi:hypothetical protein